MPISEIDRELIEKHLDKSLSETEQTAFGARLGDADFVAEIVLYQKAVYAIHAASDNKLKLMLQLEEAATPQYSPTLMPKTSQKLKTAYWFAMAASFLILVTVGYWFFTNKDIAKSKEKEEPIFAANFKPYKNFEIPNVREKNDKSDLEKAYSLYGNQDYKQALIYFEKITPPQYLDESGQFFEANALLATNQVEKAIPILTKLSQDAGSKWQQQAEWYLALTYFTRKDHSVGIQMLKNISKNALHSRNLDAQKLLEQF